MSGVPAEGSPGGRNQEVALAALHQLRSTAPAPGWAWELGALGTDGQDGPTDAAGASFTSDQACLPCPIDRFSQLSHPTTKRRSG